MGYILNMALSSWEIKAIVAINPDAAYRSKGIDNIEWLHGTSPISKSDIQTKAAELETALGYIDKRREEYPSWQDQLDDIYHNGVDGWKATIKVTKDKYPKP